MDNDIYVVLFVLYGVHDDDGSKITEVILNHQKRPEYLTDEQGVIIHLMNPKTKEMKMIEPSDTDELRHLFPKKMPPKYISNIPEYRHIYKSDSETCTNHINFTYSELIKRGFKDFKRNSGMKYEIRQLYPALYQLTFKNTVKLGNQSYNCIVRQFNHGDDGRDEVCQQKLIITRESNVHSKYDIGFRNTLRSICVYDESSICLFSNHQLFPDWFDIEIINVETGEKCHYGIGEDACYRNDVYLSKNSNRAIILNSLNL